MNDQEKTKTQLIDELRQLRAKVAALESAGNEPKNEDYHKARREFSEMLPLTIFELDMEGRFTYVNAFGLKLFGFTAEDAAGGVRLSDLISPEDNERAVENLQNILRGEGDKGLEYTVKRKDGSSLQVLVFSAPLIDEGSPIGWQGTVIDVTESRKTEKMLTEQRQILDEIFNNIKEGIGIVDADEAIVFCNPPYSRIFGKDSLALIGTRLYELFDEQTMVQIKKETTRRRQGENSSYELVLNRGTREEKVVRINATPRFDPDGNYQGAFGVVSDITEWRNMMTALEESEEKFQRVTQAANDAILLADSQGRILLYNEAAERIFGYSFREMAGKKIHEHLLPEQFEALITVDLETFGNNGRGATIGKTVEVEARHKSGHVFPAELSLSSVRHHDEWQAIGIIRDISERKATERQLKDLLSEKDILIKEIHHRVKNNFQMIASLLNIQSRQVKDEKIKSVILETRHRINTMAMVHQNLYQSNNLMHIDLSKHLSILVDDLFRSFQSRERTIGLKKGLEPVQVPVQKAIPCGLIVNELVSNALKYAFPDGWTGTPSIEVNLRLNNHRVILQVNDNGTGLPLDLDVKNSSSLGLKLVQMLSDGPLNAECVFEGGQGRGTQATIEFELETV